LFGHQEARRACDRLVHAEAVQVEHHFARTWYITPHQV
jgi:hypothetical protein